MECKNCGQNLAENDQFCGRCGQKVIMERLSLKNLLSNLIQLITNLERGLFYTVKELTLRPYSVINQFISGKTKPFYGPLRFLILWVTLAVVVNISLGLYDQQQATMTDFFLQQEDQDVIARQKKISDFFKKYANIIPLLIVPFTSLMSSLLLKKRSFNYAEHLVMNAYLAGFTSILGVIYLLFFWVFSIPVFEGLFFTTFINYGYYSWAYKKIFSYHLLSTLFRTALILFLGFLMFSIFSGGVGVIVILLFFS